MKCPKCKKQLRKNAKYCPACGAKIEKKRGVRVVSVLLVITLLLGVAAIGLGGGVLFAKYLGDDHTHIFPQFANHGNTDSVITAKQIEAAQITYNTIIAEADKLTEKYCNSNNEVTIDDLPKLLKEVAQYANELKNTGVISSFSYSDGDTCVYMQIDDWLNILYDPIVDGYMAGGLDRGFQIITLEPNASAIEMYFNYVTTGAEGADQAAQMVENSFDNFYFSTNLDDKNVTIDAFVNLPQDSIIIFSGHGGYASEVGGVLFTGVNAWDKDLISKYCEAGSRAVCFNKKGQAYLTSEFFDRYVKDEQYNGNLFYLGSCSSCQDARLVQSIWDKGARAIVGNSNSVYIRYNFRMIASFFEGLTSKDESGKYRTISEALEYAQNIHGITDGNICQVIACFHDDFRLSEMGSIPEADHFTDTSFSLSVLDAEMKAYGDYSLFISGSTSVTGPLLNKNDSQYQRSEVISSTAPIKIDLLPGTYTLTITDNANPTNAEKVTISVFDDAQLSHNIELKTTFGQENTADARGSLTASQTLPITAPTNPVEKLEAINIYDGGEFSGSIEFTYNSQNNITDVYYPESLSGFHYKYTYDNAGRLTAVHIPNSVFWQGLAPATYSYNEKNQLIMSTETEGSESKYTFEYDSEGYLIRRLGIHDSCNSIDEYTYDSMGNQIEEISTNYVDGKAVASWKTSYEYDAMGRVIKEKHLDQNSYSSYITSYDYSFPPFVIDFGSASQGYTIFLQDQQGHRLFSLYVGNADFIHDESGNLGEINSGYYNSRYEFVYNSSDERENKGTSKPDVINTAVDFSSIPNSFTFTSGVGAWSSNISLNEDGSFTGKFSDSDMGDKGSNYPKGTVRICSFSGEFSQPEYVSLGIYKIHLKNLTQQQEKGYEYIKNEIRYIVGSPYGLEESDTFYLYLPEAPEGELPLEYREWVKRLYMSGLQMPQGVYGIYNPSSGSTFVGEQ